MAVELESGKVIRDDWLVKNIIAKYLGPTCLICLGLTCFSCKKADVTAPERPTPPVTTTKQFIFPSSVGNTWTYQYVGSKWENDVVGGVHTWTTIGSDGRGRYLMLDIRQDSDKYGSLPTTFSIDSVYFTLSSTPDSIILVFPEWLPSSPVRSEFAVAHRIPLFIPSNTDSVVIDHSFMGSVLNYERATYISGVGLVSYDAIAGSQAHHPGSRLTLLSHRLH